MNELVITFLVGLIMFVVLVFGAASWERAACIEKSISFEDSQWGLISGCMVKHQGRWLPLDNIRGFDGRE